MEIKKKIWELINLWVWRFGKILFDIYACDRYKSKELRAVAMDKLRADRNIITEDGFKRKMKKASNKDLMFDLIKDL